MEITQFASDKGTQGTRVTLTWEQLCEALSTRRAPKELPKSSLPMWSPAVFRGDARAGANVEKVSCLVFDVDEDPVPTLADIAAALGDTEWFAHSSSNSTALAPRWRLLVALARPLTAEEHARAWQWWVGQLPFRVGAASKDSSRAWYAPRECQDSSFASGGG